MRSNEAENRLTTAGAVRIIMLCTVLTAGQTPSTAATSTPSSSSHCNRRTPDMQPPRVNSSDIHEYTVAMVKALRWTQVVLLASDATTLDLLSTRMEGLTVQCHLVHCVPSSPAESPASLGNETDADAAVVHTLAGLERTNILIVMSRCLQDRVIRWLGRLPDEAGPMSALVQDSHWLLLLDHAQGFDVMNMTSLRINHMAVVALPDRERNVSVKTLTWTTRGRHLETLNEGLPSVHVSSLYPNVHYGLNGERVRVAINTWTPYIMEEVDKMGKTVYRGFSMDLLEILSKSLNFTYSLHLPPDGEWGDYRDGKWTGVVGQIVRQEVDFSVAPLTPKLERTAVADWPTAMNVRYTGIGVKMSSLDGYLMMALFRPFGWQIYSTLLLVFITFACLITGLLLLESKLLQQDQRAPSFLFVVEFLFGSLLKEIVPSKLLKHDGVRRPLIAAWCVFGLLVTSCYTSKLTSLLVDVSPPPPFNSLQEMVESGDFRWGMIGGTALLNSFRLSNNTVMKAAYKGVMSFVQEDPDVLSLDAEVHRAKMLSGGYAYIGEEALQDLWAAEDCSIRVIRERIVGMETYNVFTPKRSVLTDRIDATLLKLEAGGIMDQLKAKWWPVENQCLTSATSQTAIQMATMQGAFYLAAAGLVLAVLALLAETLPRSQCWALTHSCWSSKEKQCVDTGQE